MTAPALEPGTPVRFTAGPLGLLDGLDAGRFVDETVSTGDVGTYHGPHPHLGEWHLVRVEVDGEAPKRLEMFCPCHASQFEAVTA